jgi:hypothetical protein
MKKELTTKSQETQTRSHDLINMGREITLPKEVGDVIAAKINEALEELNETNPRNIDLTKGGGIEKEYTIIAHISSANPHKMLFQTRIFTAEK